MSYFNVNYLLEKQNGDLRNFTRSFHDEEMARSECTFSKGTVLTTGEKIIDVQMKKEK